jgi:hypothetical protein
MGVDRRDILYSASIYLGNTVLTTGVRVRLESETIEARHRYGGFVNMMGLRILILVSVCAVNIQYSMHVCQFRKQLLCRVSEALGKY